jgi:hypothetical protein
MQREQLAAMSRLLCAPAGRKAAIVDAFAGRLNYLAIVHSKAVRGVLRLAGTAPVKKAVAGHLEDLGRHAGGLLAALAVWGRGKRRPARLSRRMVSPFNTPMPPQAHKVRPAPAVSGPITYDPIPPNEREGHSDPRWDGPVNIALGWADGQRTLAEVAALAEHEAGRPLPGLAQELLWLIPHGLLRDAARP